MCGVLLLIVLEAGAIREQDRDTAAEWGQRNRAVSIDVLSGAFRYSPSSRFAPGDGGAELDWIDNNPLKVQLTRI